MVDGIRTMPWIVLAACSTSGDAASVINDGGGGAGHGDTTTEAFSTTETGDGTSSSGFEMPDCGERAPGEALDLEAVVSIDCAVTDGCTATPEDSAAATLAGPFTVVAEVRFDQRPGRDGAIVSRWDTANDARSFEVGIDQHQTPYVYLSADGLWAGASDTYAHGPRQLRVGESYEVAVVVDPGERIAIFVDGLPTHEQSEVIESIHLGSSTLGIGHAPGSASDDFGHALGRVRVFDRALDDEEIAALAIAHGHCNDLPELPELTPLTQGPRFHWFGYYDKLQFDATDRWVLGMSVDFEQRKVTADDVAEIGMIDLQNGHEWVHLAETRAFNWQQGCMLQWRPGTATQIVFNDREGEAEEARFVTRILDVATDTLRTVPFPVYTIGPDGTSALSIDFHRLARMRTGYGYLGVEDPSVGINAPADMGIHALDLETGDHRLLLSLADIAAIPASSGPNADAEHFFEMLQINPSGTRFSFMHRWKYAEGNAITRIFTADMDGSDLFMLVDEGMLSHMTWSDDEHIVVYAYHWDGYASFADGVGYESTIMLADGDGHETFLPGGEWMLSDTYADWRRLQHPFLYHLPTNEVFSLAHLLSPDGYSGGHRCDTHPRQSRDGRRVVVDSAHEGGRQMYLVDVGEILDAVE